MPSSGKCQQRSSIKWLLQICTVLWTWFVISSLISYVAGVEWSLISPLDGEDLLQQRFVLLDCCAFQTSNGCLVCSTYCWFPNVNDKYQFRHALLVFVSLIFSVVHNKPLFILKLGHWKRVVFGTGSLYWNWHGTFASPTRAEDAECCAIWTRSEFTILILVL